MSKFLFVTNKYHNDEYFCANSLQELVAVWLNSSKRIIIITLLSNHRVEIHFALWRVRKNTIVKSHSNACIQQNQACKYVNGS